jgi:hypothetical protein
VSSTITSKRQPPTLVRVDWFQSYPRAANQEAGREKAIERGGVALVEIRLRRELGG